MDYQSGSKQPHSKGSAGAYRRVLRQPLESLLQCVETGKGAHPQHRISILEEMKVCGLPYLYY
jgi:hypothetical protein